MSQNPNALPATVASSLAPSSSTAASPHTSATRQPHGRIYRSQPAGTPAEPTVSGARSAGKSRGGTRPSNTPPANPPPHGGSGVHGDSDDDVPSGASRAVASGAGGSRVVNDLALASQAIISVIKQNFNRTSMPGGTWPYIKVDGSTSTKPEPLFFITDLKGWPSFYVVKPNPKAVEALCGLSNVPVEAKIVVRSHGHRIYHKETNENGSVYSVFGQLTVPPRRVVAFDNATSIAEDSFRISFSDSRLCTRVYGDEVLFMCGGTMATFDDSTKCEVSTDLQMRLPEFLIELLGLVEVPEKLAKDALLHVASFNGIVGKMYSVMRQKVPGNSTELTKLVTELNTSSTRVGAISDRILRVSKDIKEQPGKLRTGQASELFSTLLRNSRDHIRELVLQINEFYGKLDSLTEFMRANARVQILLEELDLEVCHEVIAQTRVDLNCIPRLRDGFDLLLGDLARHFPGRCLMFSIVSGVKTPTFKPADRFLVYEGFVGKDEGSTHQGPSYPALPMQEGLVLSEDRVTVPPGIYTPLTLSRTDATDLLTRGFNTMLLQTDASAGGANTTPTGFSHDAVCVRSTDGVEYIPVSHAWKRCITKNKTAVLTVLCEFLTMILSGDDALESGSRPVSIRELIGTERKLIDYFSKELIGIVAKRGVDVERTDTLRQPPAVSQCTTLAAESPRYAWQMQLFGYVATLFKAAVNVRYHESLSGAHYVGDVVDALWGKIVIFRRATKEAAAQQNSQTKDALEQKARDAITDIHVIVFAGKHSTYATDLKTIVEQVAAEPQAGKVVLVNKLAGCRSIMAKLSSSPRIQEKIEQNREDVVYYIAPPTSTS